MIRRVLIIILLVFLAACFSGCQYLMVGGALALPLPGLPPLNPNAKKIVVIVEAPTEGESIYLNGLRTNRTTRTMIGADPGELLSIHGDYRGVWVIGKKANEKFVRFNQQETTFGQALFTDVGHGPIKTGYWIRQELTSDQLEELINQTPDLRCLWLDVPKTALPPVEQTETIIEHQQPELALDFLAAQPGLWLLDLPDRKLGDTTALTQLGELRYLNLVRTNLTAEKVAVLSDLKNLIYINVAGTMITDLVFLGELDNLQVLDVADTRINDLSPLAELIALRSINLSGTQASDLTPLDKLWEVLDLNLSGTQVTDIAVLSRLWMLQRLDLSRTQISDLSALTNLVRLQKLILTDTPVTESDIADLQEKLPHLEIIR